MICPACEEIFPPESFGEPKCCPACGAYYDKALKLRIARKAAAVNEQQKASIPTAETAPKTAANKVTMAAAGSKIDNVLRAVISPTVAKPVGAIQQKGRPVYRGDMYCTSCGSIGGSKRYVPGSILIEILLWVCFLIPGVIYTIWRYSSSQNVCKVCSMPTQIPARSPLAQKMLHG